MKSLIAALILILLPVPTLVADEYATRVVGISDGVTLTVLTAQKKQVKIRLHGIDAPETGQAYGTKAKQAASELAFGKEVTIRPVDTDRYGRTVAEVILPGGKSLNREMVGRERKTGKIGKNWCQFSFSHRLSPGKNWCQFSFSHRLSPKIELTPTFTTRNSGTQLLP